MIGLGHEDNQSDRCIVIQIYQTVHHPLTSESSPSSIIYLSFRPPSSRASRGRAEIEAVMSAGRVLFLPCLDALRYSCSSPNKSFTSMSLAGFWPAGELIRGEIYVERKHV